VRTEPLDALPSVAAGGSGDGVGVGGDCGGSCADSEVAEEPVEEEFDLSEIMSEEVEEAQVRGAVAYAHVRIRMRVARRGVLHTTERNACRLPQRGMRAACMERNASRMPRNGMRAVCHVACVACILHKVCSSMHGGMASHVMHELGTMGTAGHADVSTACITSAQVAAAERLAQVEAELAAEAAKAAEAQAAGKASKKSSKKKSKKGKSKEEL